MAGRAPDAEHLRELGLTRWRQRMDDDGRTAADGPAAEAAPADESKSADGRTLTLDPAAAKKHAWRKARRQVEECTRCELHRSRRNTVFGVGGETADLMLVGEAPGADEDAQGEPFVGPAGLLLNRMLAAIGLAREDVFIANILKCRPPGNTNPTPEQAEQCRGHLERQLDLLEPKVILALGAVAARNLLGVEAPIGALRGKEFPLPERSGIVVLPTYHPAYLLRRPQGKAQAFEDLLALRAILDRD